MNDITRTSNSLVSRLRCWADGDHWALRRRAADEVERLQRQVEQLEEDLVTANDPNPRASNEPPPALPEYTNAIGDAGAEYLKSVGAYGRHPFTSGNFYWHKLWDVMCKAAGASPPPVPEYESIGWQYKHHSSWGDGSFVWTDSPSHRNGGPPVEAREIFVRATSTKGAG
jgi:hypothetical protein